MSSSMNFALTDDQQAFVELAHDFAKKEIRPAAAHHDTTGEYPHQILQKAHDMGLMNAAIPERCGGLGLDCLTQALISEEIAWGCTGIGTAMEANGLALAPVLLGGSDALLEKYVAPMIDEYSLACYAVTEPGAGSDVQGMRSNAVKRGDKWILNGSKMWITNAGVAKWIFVVVVTDPQKMAERKAHQGGMTAFIVDADAPGIEIGKKEWNMGQRCSDTRAITFSDVEISEANVVGEVGMGWALAMGAFDHTRPVVASAAVGLARAAMEHAAQYAMERKTFGKPIAKHQAINFMIADMAMNIEAARLLVQKSAWLKSQRMRNTKEAAFAKAFAADMAMKVATDAVQVFGGYGFNTEYPVEKLMRDAKIFQIYEGTSQIQRLIIGRELFAGR